MSKQNYSIDLKNPLLSIDYYRCQLICPNLFPKIEDTANRYQLLTDSMLEVMVQYYIRMYRKKLPKWKITFLFFVWLLKCSFYCFTLMIFCPVMAVFFELRRKQRQIPWRLCSCRSAMITFGLVCFWLFKLRRLVYGFKPGR